MARSTGFEALKSCVLVDDYPTYDIGDKSRDDDYGEAPCRGVGRAYREDWTGEGKFGGDDKAAVFLSDSEPPSRSTPHVVPWYRRGELMGIQEQEYKAGGRLGVMPAS